MKTLNECKRCAVQNTASLVATKGDLVGHIGTKILDLMPNGVALCRMLFEDGVPCDYVYLYTNPAFNAQAGLGDICGKRITDVIPGIRDTDPQLFEIYGRVAAGGKSERFETHVKALRQWFSIHVFCPQPDHFVTIFDDITPRKQCEDQLRIQAVVLDQIQDHVTITDLNGTVTYVNRAETAAGHHSEATMSGQPVSAAGEGPQADATQQEIVDATRTHGTWKGKVVDVRPDGSSIILDLRTTLVKDDAGQPVAMVGIGTDITERQRAEDVRAAGELERLRVEGALHEREQQFRTLATSSDRMAFLLSVINQELGCLSPHFELLRQQLSGALEITDSSVIAVINRINAVHELSRRQMDRIEQSMQASLSLVGVAEQQSNNIQQAILLVRHEIQFHLDSLNQNLTRSQALADEVGELSGILAVIENLARQSKLLAINALIEAAHAHGFGDPFGVVASEMKKLSFDTARAAADIGIKIGRLSSKMAEQLVTVKTAILTVQESAARLQAIVQDITLAEERFHSSSDELKGAIGDLHANNTDVVTQLTEALGELQFQDVVYQRVGQVQKALQELGEHAQSMVDNISDPSWDGVFHPTLRERLDLQLSAYVMASQRDTHAAVIGEDAATSSDGPAIELF